MPQSNGNSLLLVRTPNKNCDKSAEKAPAALPFPMEKQAALQLVSRHLCSAVHSHYSPAERFPQSGCLYTCSVKIREIVFFMVGRKWKKTYDKNIKQRAS